MRRVYDGRMQGPRVTASLGLLVSLAVVIAGSVYFVDKVRAPLTASQGDVVGLPERNLRETVFPSAQRVVWDGTIEGVLAGGRGRKAEVRAR